jgi:hypothetical protein
MKRSFVIVALSLLSLNAHAALNKWVDADGKVHYSDIVPPDVSTQTVRNISGNGQETAAPGFTPKSLAEREADLRKSTKEKEEAAKKKAQQDAQAEARKNNCNAARENVQTLEHSPTIVTYDANGERTYLDEAARAQRLEEARKAISTDCN